MRLLSVVISPFCLCFGKGFICPSPGRETARGEDKCWGAAGLSVFPVGAFGCCDPSSVLSSGWPGAIKEKMDLKPQHGADGNTIPPLPHHWAADIPSLHMVFWVKFQFGAGDPPGSSGSQGTGREQRP